MREVDSFDSKQLKSLIEEICHLHSSLNERESLLLQIVKSAVALLLCENGSLFLTDSVTHKTVCVCAFSASGGDDDSKRNAGESTIAEWVVQNKEKLVFHNEASNKAFFSSAHANDCALYSNVLALPFWCGGTCLGALVLFRKNWDKPFRKSECEFLDFFLKAAGQIYANVTACFADKQVCSMLLGSKRDGEDILLAFDSLSDTMRVIDEIARTNTIVSISGEAGVGKEFFARNIHKKSPRCKNSFVVFNCALADVHLLEEAFSSADGGTLFLDGVERLSRQMQERLFEFIKNHSLCSPETGGVRVCDARIIASSGKDLLGLVSDGSFMTDLYYRLSVFPLNIPPLRERKADIPLFADFFLRKWSAQMHKKISGFSQEAMNVLVCYYWPGNVRELENAVERACIKSSSDYIQVDDFGGDFFGNNFSDEDIGIVAEEIFHEEKDKTLRNAMVKFKSFYVKKVLVEHGWNQTQVGKVLGIQRTYVSRLLKDLDLR